jgi:hypothetical protein
MHSGFPKGTGPTRKVFLVFKPATWHGPQFPAARSKEFILAACWSVPQGAKNEKKIKNKRKKKKGKK